MSKISSFYVCQALAMLLMANAASAQDAKTTMVGSFMVRTEKDPFDGKDSVVAMTASGDWGVGVRCIQSGLSLAIVTTDTKINTGDVFLIKIRADSKDILEEKGTAISDKLIEVSDEADKIIDQALGAKSLSIRIMGDTVVTFTIPMKSSDKAIGAVKTACAK